MDVEAEVDEAPALPGPEARRRRWRFWLALAIYGAVCVFVTDRYLVSFATMASDSMMPTLRGNPDGCDVVLVDRFTHHFRAPRRGEIVQFRGDDGEYVLKRVVALPGEVVEIRAGRLLIDGSPITRPARIARIHYENRGHLAPGKRVRIKPDYFFVLGDDSSDSYDSRYWGGLARSRISGMAWAIAWPPERVTDLAITP